MSRNQPYFKVNDFVKKLCHWTQKNTHPAANAKITYLKLNNLTIIIIHAYIFVKKSPLKKESILI